MKKNTALMQYLLLYLDDACISSRAPFLWAAFVEDSYIGIAVVSVLTLCAVFVYKVKVPLSFYFFCLATFLCYLLSSVINGIGLAAGLNIKTALIVDLNILMAITIYNMDPEKAISRFVKVIICLATVSLIFYGVTLVFGYGILNSVFSNCVLRERLSRLLILFIIIAGQQKQRDIYRAGRVSDPPDGSPVLLYLLW